MKKAIAFVIAASMALASCGRPQTFNGKDYPTYGLFNEAGSHSNNICYTTSIGNIVWSILLIETVIFPVYFIGFSLYNPSRLKHGDHDDCSFDGT